MKKRPKNWKPRIPRDARIEFTETPPIPRLDDYELPAQVALDPKKFRPNRFAGQVRFTRGGARQGAGRKPSPEPLLSKHVYLAPRHIKILKRVDKNLSAAIRKLAEAAGSRK
ncbi:hypothetical protein FBQ82_19185 [Anaerolineae bacterium CFX7]|nr:hypothetical protein [Anaerolineae bacterium CFX7]RIK22604.1 MAG: hypothetical protein DCC52_13635 [Chloroflexota bacterium]